MNINDINGLEVHTLAYARGSEAQFALIAQRWDFHFAVECSPRNSIEILEQNHNPQTNPSQRCER